jgi:hypothetical protein
MLNAILAQVIKKSKNIDNNSVKSDNKEIPLRNRPCLFLANIV